MLAGLSMSVRIVKQYEREPLPGRLGVPRRRTNAAVTEPRRADADSDRHHPPSVLLRRAQTPPVEKLVEAYKTIATPSGKGW
jgi:hypothetical protein